MKKKSMKMSNGQSKRSSKLSSMSVDDFMNTIGDESSDEDSVDEPSRNALKNGHAASSSNQNESDGSSAEVDSSDEDLDENSDDDAEDEEEEESEDEVEEDEDEEEVDKSVVDDDNSEAEDVGVKHKQALHKLKDTDPEFYKFLQENDRKLLQFNLSDESDDDGEQGVEPTDKSDEDSDESDQEKEDDQNESGRTGGVITLKKVREWREKLSSDRSVQTICDAIHAFHAALQRVSPVEGEASVFKVEGSPVFNAVVQMCVLDLLPALRRYLKLPQGSLSRAEPQKCKRWPKVKALVKSYITDLLQLLEGIASVNISTILLKHIHQMSPFIVSFHNVSKSFLKKMISIWGTGEETVRVVAFMCILRVTTSQQRTLLDQTLRVMYMTYIQNTKFVSPNTLPGINFMRRSLTEMFLLDENVSYHHAFLYIRQLAIHLRNAITLQKKESIQTVYNWQYIGSLSLWVELLSASSKQALEPLLYPVVQVLTGTLKLVPTAQYYPLRFHCVNLLIKLTRGTGTFVPVLPFLLEVLNSYDFNKKHTKVTMKPMNFSCVLRLSKAQLQENGFKDAVIEAIYSSILDYLACESHSLAFPDMTVPAIMQLRSFLKECKVANHTKKIRQIVEKIEENSKFIEKERKSVSFALSDQKAVETWETSIKVKGTPLMSFFSSWQNMMDMKQSKEKVDQVVMKHKKKGQKNYEGVFDTLPEMSDSDEDDEDDRQTKRRKRKSEDKNNKRSSKSSSKVGKKKAKPDESFDLNDGAEDIVQDASLAEW